MLLSDLNNPNKTTGDKIYDGVKVALDIASFIPPVALGAGALRLGLGLFDLFHTDGPAVINDVNNAANGSHQLISGQLAALGASLATVTGLDVIENYRDSGQ